MANDAAQSNDPPRPAPLAGVRVLELASWIAGPFAGAVLADFGADVVKVELPGRGDEARQLGGLEEADPSRSAWWITFSRNKRSLTLDVRVPEGRDIFLTLAARTDVVIESFRPGTLERWGIGWTELAAVNPGLVLLRVSGFGQTGPYRERPGFDRVAQAFAGLMYLTGEPDQPPTRAGLPIVDYGAGVWGALGVMLALRARELDPRKRGQVIDQALYDALVPYLADIPFDFVRHGRVRERTGSRDAKVAPGGVYRTADGHWLMISATGDMATRRFLATLGLEHILDDERFATNDQRLRHRDELEHQLTERIGALPVNELERVLREQGVPFSRVNHIGDLLADEHVASRGDFTTIDDPRLGRIPTARPRPLLSATPGHIRRSGPMLGEHTVEVLSEAGYTRHEIEELATRGVI